MGGRLAGSLGLVAVLAGCLFPGCGSSVDNVTWVEPGLYATVDHGSFQPAYWGAVWTPPKGALPFKAEFAGQPDHALAVDAVSWSGWPSVAFTLDRDGVVSGGAMEDVDNATLVQAFLAFTANVTTAPTAQRIGWADEFHRTRRLEWEQFEDQQAVDEDRGTGFYTYSARVDGPFRLEALANETGARWAAPLMQSREPGRAMAEGGGYTWQLGLATWTVPLPHGSRGAELLVDPLDRVAFDGAFREGVSTADVQDRIREAMVEDGLPAPTFQDYGEDRSIC